MRAASSLLAFTLLVGCVSAPPSAPVEGPVKLGQVAYVGGLRIRPERILQNSRCPADTQCIWAGALEVRVTVFGGGWTKQADLTLGVPVPIADGSLQLVSVEPQHTTTRRVAGKDLLLTFDFQGGF